MGCNFWSKYFKRELDRGPICWVSFDSRKNPVTLKCKIVKYEFWISGDESQTEFFKLEEIHDNKFASMFLGVVSDLVFETFETFDIGGKTEEWKNYLKKMFANAMIGFSSRNGEISDCSVNTFRFFRSMVNK